MAPPVAGRSPFQQPFPPQTSLPASPLRPTVPPPVASFTPTTAPQQASANVPPPSFATAPSSAPSQAAAPLSSGFTPQQPAQLQNNAPFAPPVAPVAAELPIVPVDAPQSQQSPNASSQSKNGLDVQASMPITDDGEHKEISVRLR